MKKVLMVIFVLSLLGLLAAPVLANVLTEGGPYNEVLVKGMPPGGFYPSAGGEEPVQIAINPGGLYPPAPRS